MQKFLIDEVCKIHHNENSAVNEAILRENLSIKNIFHKLEDGKRAFNIYSLNGIEWEYYLIGDIHSDTISMVRILEKTDFFNMMLKRRKVRLVFLGDYVDRGKAHLKLLQYVLTLKYLFPQHIILERGNHDGGSFIDGEVKLWSKRPDDSIEEDWLLLYLYNLSSLNKTLPTDIIHNYLRFLDTLSIVTFIYCKNKIIMTAHGGIPRPREEAEGFYHYITNISCLTDESITDCLDRSVRDNMMWSDPAIDETDLRENRVRFRFTEKHFEAFRKLIGFDFFVRGHQTQENGYRLLFDGRLISIFSSGKILKDGEDKNTETAYTRVNPHIMNVSTQGEVSFIDLNA